MSKLALPLSAALLLAVAAPARAAGGVHEHDGFFLRLEPGIGYFHTGAEQGGETRKLYGWGGDFGFAIGGALTPNLVLAGHIFATSASDPEAEANGQTASTTDTTAGLVGIGPQLTWYFMPVNAYLSGTLALTRVNVKSDGNDANTDWGVGLRVGAGKEWWVSDNWGLGVSANLGLSSNEDSGSGSPTFRSWTASVNFSATYN